MAELTHLNEASVVHNLHMRYQSDLIYVSTHAFLASEYILTMCRRILASFWLLSTLTAPSQYTPMNI